MPWSQRFADPISLPDGRTLKTLRDAGNYVASLPKAEQSLAHWQAAAEALILVGNHGGDPMLARIGMMMALSFGVERPAIKKRARKYTVIP